MGLTASRNVTYHLVVLQVDGHVFVVVVRGHHGIATIRRQEGVVQHAADLGQFGDRHIRLVWINNPDLSGLAQCQCKLVIDTTTNNRTTGGFDEIAVRVLALQSDIFHWFQGVGLQDNHAVGYEGTQCQPLAIFG